MSGASDNGQSGSLSRRQFIQSVAATGAAYIVSRSAAGQSAPASAPATELKVAIIGVGSQGTNLLNESLKIPGLRYAAVCDMWPFAQTRGAGLLAARGQNPNVYADYREMLDKEKGLDAVIVATPDWMHAEHTCACLAAGAHVYCEKEMSNTLAGARQMVQAARSSGRLLQIGHQRRSNPRYQHGLRLIETDRILGRITTINGQWNRSISESGEIGWAKSVEMDAATLAKYGYEDMRQFRNWRWFRKYAGGPIVDLGSHQVDVYGWYLHATPRSVIASGGQDYYKDRQWYDNVMAIYEFDTPAGVVRALYQVNNTTSCGGFFETFMGDQGSLTISENTKVGCFFRELAAPQRDWEKEAHDTINAMSHEGAIQLNVGATLDPSGRPTPQAQSMMAAAAKPVHLLHLENFFDAIRSGGATPLTCPPEVAYKTAVAVLAVNDALERGCKVEFKPEDFKV